MEDYLTPPRKDFCEHEELTIFKYQLRLYRNNPEKVINYIQMKIDEKETNYGDIHKIFEKYYYQVVFMTAINREAQKKIIVFLANEGVKYPMVSPNEYQPHHVSHKPPIVQLIMDTDKEYISFLFENGAVFDSKCIAAIYRHKEIANPVMQISRYWKYNNFDERKLRNLLACVVEDGNVEVFDYIFDNHILHKYDINELMNAGKRFLEFGAINCNYEHQVANKIYMMRKLYDNGYIPRIALKSIITNCCYYVNREFLEFFYPYTLAHYPIDRANPMKLTKRASSYIGYSGKKNHDFTMAFLKYYKYISIYDLVRMVERNGTEETAEYFMNCSIDFDQETRKQFMKYNDKKSKHPVRKIIAVRMREKYPSEYLTLQPVINAP
jgi:hypothetical protein